MKTKHTKLTYIVSVLLALIMCVSMAMPAIAAVPAADVKAPLSGLVATNATDKLAPEFNQNTTVYTLKAAAVPAGEGAVDAATALITPTAPEGTGIEVAYDVRTQILTISTENADGDTSKYYVSITDAAPEEANPTADINVIKVLRTSDIDITEDGKQEPKVDSLEFKYDLIPVGTVANTTISTHTGTNPLSAKIDDDADTNGNLTVAANVDGKSVMTMNAWDAVTSVIGTDHPLADQTHTDANGEQDLDGDKYMEGKFAVTFTEVGQYTYLLHEEQPAEKDKIEGVTYDDDWYLVTISVVHIDPNDPTSLVTVGWVEVAQATVENPQDPTNTYTKGDKVNFGENTQGGEGNDSEKYTSGSTAVTYPFVNTLATDNLTVSKTVTGDLGDAAQEFLFKVEISGSNMAASYDIGYSVVAKSANTANPEAITTTTNDATGISTGSQLITLNHGENFTIYGLPVGCTYKVTELVADENDTLASATEAMNYATTVTTDKSCAATAISTITPPATDADVDEVTVGKEITSTLFDSSDNANNVDYVNDKSIDPPTGAFMDMIPYMSIVVVAAAALVIFMVAKKRRSAAIDEA